MSTVIFRIESTVLASLANKDKWWFDEQLNRWVMETDRLPEAYSEYNHADCTCIVDGGEVSIFVVTKNLLMSRASTKGHNALHRTQSRG